MPEYILYDTSGMKHVYNHMIDVRTALATGAYFAERPTKKKKVKPVKESQFDPDKIETKMTPAEKMKAEVKTKTEIDKMEEKAKEKK